MGNGTAGSGGLTLAVVIPTKNRPQDLAVALDSVVLQRRPPDELILVDQSDVPMVPESLAGLQQTLPLGASLVYVHDRNISGLVHAKDVGVRRSVSDVVAFLEDDIELEPDYLRVIEEAFFADPHMVGCCGVVTNPPVWSASYVAFHELFHRGLFEDPRPRIFRTEFLLPGASGIKVESHALSGGLSAWRRRVFSEVPFDISGRFHMLEDFEFSTRVHERFGRNLYVLPQARLAHHMAPAGRASMGVRHRTKVVEYILLYRQRRRFPSGIFDVVWLVLGLFMAAAWDAVKGRSFAPILGTIQGLGRAVRR